MKTDLEASGPVPLSAASISKNVICNLHKCVNCSTGIEQSLFVDALNKCLCVGPKSDLNKCSTDAQAVVFHVLKGTIDNVLPLDVGLSHPPFQFHSSVSQFVSRAAYVMVESSETLP